MQRRDHPCVHGAKPDAALAPLNGTLGLAGAGDLHGVASDAWAGTVLAVDSLGSIWSSGDAGVTFTRDGAAGVSLDAVSTTQSGTSALAVGAGGKVLFRGASGAWAPIATGSGVDLHAALVTDPTVQQSFLDNALRPLLQHVAASSYKDYVLAYDIMN